MIVLIIVIAAAGAGALAWSFYRKAHMAGSAGLQDEASCSGNTVVKLGELQTQEAVSFSKVQAVPTIHEAEDLDVEAERLAERNRRVLLASEQAVRLAQIRAALDVVEAYCAERERVARESRRLERELERDLATKLNEANFEEYRKLHRQSYKLADRRYRSYEEVRDDLRGVNEVLRSIGSGEIRMRQDEKANVRQTRDALAAICDSHLANVRLLNNQTHALKMKIRNECGERGRRWYEDLEERTRQRRAAEGKR